MDSIPTRLALLMALGVLSAFREMAGNRLQRRLWPVPRKWRSTPFCLPFMLPQPLCSGLVLDVSSYCCIAGGSQFQEDNI